MSNDFKPDLILYHDKCADGIVAAWACWTRWGDEPDYRAVNYGFQPPADVANKHVLLVDFSFSTDDLSAMIQAGALSIVILDHHKTAQEALAPFQRYAKHPERFTTKTIGGMVRDLRNGGYPPICAQFDMNRSGAGLAWSFAHPGEPVPELVSLAQQYDLWQFNPLDGDDAELLHLEIQRAGMTIENMEALHHELRHSRAPIERGRAIYEWRKILVAEIVQRAETADFAGHFPVKVVEAPYMLVSTVGHTLLAQDPNARFAMCTVSRPLSVSHSMRSDDSRADVSAIAKQFGGGGHRNAASFRVDQSFPKESVLGLADARALLLAAEKLLPENLCLTNQQIPDDTLIPFDVPIGDLRALDKEIQKQCKCRRGGFALDDNASDEEALIENCGDAVTDIIETCMKPFGFIDDELRCAEVATVTALKILAGRASLYWDIPFEEEPSPELLARTVNEILLPAMAGETLPHHAGYVEDELEPSAVDAG